MNRRSRFRLLALTVLATTAANAAIFAAVHAVLTRPLTYADPDRLAWISEARAARPAPATTVTPACPGASPEPAPGPRSAAARAARRARVRPTPSATPGRRADSADPAASPGYE